MSNTIISIESAIIDLFAIAYTVGIRPTKIKVPAIITFSLLFIGEVIDIVGPNPLINSIFIEENIELYVSIGLLITVYYINLQSKRIRRK